MAFSLSKCFNTPGRSGGEERSDVNSLNHQHVYHTRQDVSPGYNDGSEESETNPSFHDNHTCRNIFEPPRHFSDNHGSASYLPRCDYSSRSETSDYHRFHRGISVRHAGYDYAWYDSSHYQYGRGYNNQTDGQALRPQQSGSLSKQQQINATLPTEYVTDVLPSDILSGRGGATNSHSGNKGFRKLVKEYQTLYLKAKKQDKLKVAKALVKKVRADGGRFLKRHSASIEGVLWVDIGDEEAIIKAAQCLREGAADRRKRQSSSESSLASVSGNDSITSMSLASILEAYSSEEENENTKKEVKSMKKESVRQDISKMIRGTEIVTDFDDESRRLAEASRTVIEPNMSLAGESRETPFRLLVHDLDDTDRNLYLSYFSPPNSSTKTKLKAKSTKRKKITGNPLASKPARVDGRPGHYQRYQSPSYATPYQDPRWWYSQDHDGSQLAHMGFPHCDDVAGRYPIRISADSAFPSHDYLSSQYHGHNEASHIPYCNHPENSLPTDDLPPGYSGRFESV